MSKARKPARSSTPLPQHLAATLVFVMLSLAACHRNPNISSDGRMTDGRASDGPARCRHLYVYDYVIDEMRVPASPSEARSMADDLDNDGTADNALGSLLAAMHSAGWPGFAPAIRSGKQLTLIRIVTNSLEHGADTYGFIWNAPNQDCKQQTCFSRIAIFRRTALQPANTVFLGYITNNIVHFFGLDARLSIFLSRLTSILLTPLAGELHAHVSIMGMKSGRITGVVTTGEARTTLVPALARALDDTLDDPATPAATRGKLGAAFDSNGDGTITTDEFAASKAVKQYLAGDVDVDVDGNLEVSLGLEFSAVRAHIDEPPCLGIWTVQK